MKSKITYTKLSDFETKFDFKKHTFILKEGNRGFFGAGRSVSLYQLDGLKREFIVSVGWLIGDSQPSFENDLIKGITNMDKIKEESINYLTKLL